MPHPGATPYVYILSSCAWFAAMGLLAHEAAREGCHWLMIVVARSSFVAVVALAALIVLRIRPAILRPRGLWLRSLAGSISMLATFYALANMPVSDVLVVTNTFPIWVAVMAWPLAGERPTVAVVLAALCAVAGIAIALQPGQAGFDWRPVLAAAVAAAFTAAAMLGLNRLRNVAPLAVVLHFSVISACVGGFALLVFAEGNGRWAGLDRAEPLWLLAAVGLSATGGQIFLTLAYAAGSPVRVSIVALTQVVMVLAIETAIGRKTLGPHAVIGTLLVLAPAAWLIARDRRPTRTTEEVEVEEVAIE